jgi:hypothetical protein
MHNANVTQLPAWKEAVSNFDFDYGDVISKEWLYESFGLEKPTAFTPNDKVKQIELAFLSNFKKLEEYLLEERQMALKTLRSVGYEIIQPNEQTQWALFNGMADMKKALKTMYRRNVNVNHNLLNAEDKKKNSDALARTAMLKTMVDRFEKKKLTFE